mgnify:CR=1 FL=1
MFDIGFWELLILFGLGLVILGPERLPRVAMQVGRWAGQARSMARALTTQIRDELDVDLNQTIKPTTPQTPNYHRPGVDDLKPGHTDAAAATDEQPATDVDSATARPAPESPADERA